MRRHCELDARGPWGRAAVVAGAAQIWTVCTAGVSVRLLACRFDEPALARSAHLSVLALTGSHVPVLHAREIRSVVTWCRTTVSRSPPITRKGWFGSGAHTSAVISSAGGAADQRESYGVGRRQRPGRRRRLPNDGSLPRGMAGSAWGAKIKSKVSQYYCEPRLRAFQRPAPACCS